MRMISNRVACHHESQNVIVKLSEDLRKTGLDTARWISIRRPTHRLSSGQKRVLKHTETSVSKPTGPTRPAFCVSPVSNGMASDLRHSLSPIRYDIRRASYHNEWGTTNAGTAARNVSNYFAWCLFHNAQYIDIMLLQKQENTTEEGEE